MLRLDKALFFKFDIALMFANGIYFLVKSELWAPLVVLQFLFAVIYICARD